VANSEVSLPAPLSGILRHDWTRKKDTNWLRLFFGDKPGPVRMREGLNMMKDGWKGGGGRGIEEVRLVRSVSVLFDVS